MDRRKEGSCPSISRRKCAIASSSMVASPPKASPPEIAFEFLGRFSFDNKKLGKGGSGTVMRGRHLETNKAVAIKIINPTKRSCADRARRLFEREVKMHKIASDMEGVIRFIDSSTPTSTGRCYLATELAPMGDLFFMLSNNLSPLHEDDVRNVTLKLVNAVAGLHRINMVHRDIKPENILMMNYTTCEELEDVIVKLADFGHADRMPGNGKRLNTRDCGTAGYRAPELEKGWKHGHGLVADMWSVGAVMSDLFDFRPVQPFPSDERFWRKPVWQSVSPEAKDLMKRLLEPDPSARMTSEQALEHPWLREKPTKLSEVAGNLVLGFDPASNVRERDIGRMESQESRCQFPDVASETARENEVFDTKPPVTLPGLGRFSTTARPQLEAVTKDFGPLQMSHDIGRGNDAKKAAPSILRESFCNAVNGDFGKAVNVSPAMSGGDSVDLLIRDVCNFDDDGGSGGGEGDLQRPPPAVTDFSTTPPAIDGNNAPVPAWPDVMNDGLDPAGDNWNLMGNDIAIDNCNCSTDGSTDPGKGSEKKRTNVDTAGTVSRSAYEGGRNEISPLGGKCGGSGATRIPWGAECSLQDSPNSFNLKGKRPRARVDGVSTLGDSTNVKIKGEVRGPPSKRRANLGAARSKQKDAGSEFENS